MKTVITYFSAFNYFKRSNLFSNKLTLMSIFMLLVCTSMTAQLTTVNVPDADLRVALNEASIYVFLGPGNNEITVQNIQSISVLNLNNKSISNAEGLQAFTGLGALFIGDNQLSTLDLSTMQSHLAVLQTDGNSSLYCIKVADVDAAYERVLYNNWSKSSYQEYSLTGGEPTVTSAPGSVVNAGVGYPNTYSITADDAITYQWKVDTNGNGSFNNISDNSLYSGTSTANLTITPTMSMNGYTYRCRVDNNCGSPNDYDFFGSRFTLYVHDVVNVPDANLREALKDHYTYTITQGQVANELVVQDIETIDALDLVNKSITNVTGLERFTKLETLDLQNNNISSFNISNLNLLSTLKLSDNALTSINISNLDALTLLYLKNNNLTTVDVSNLTNLTRLEIQNNNLSALDVSDIQYGLDVFYATGNPNLNCIIVSNEESAINASNWTRDASANYSSSDQGPVFFQQPFDTEGLMGYDAYLNAKSLEVVSYQWQVSVDNGYSFSNLSNNSTYSGVTEQYLVINPTEIIDGNKYRNRATNACGTSYSNVVNFTTISRVVTPDSDLRTALIASGNEISLSPVSSITLRVPSIKNIATLNLASKSISNATGIERFTSLTALSLRDNQLSSLNLSALQDGLDVLDLRENPSLSCVAVNNPNTIPSSWVEDVGVGYSTTGNSPVITSQPSAITVSENSVTNFSVSTLNATSYQWQVSIDNGVTFTNISDDGSIYSGAETTTLSVTPPFSFNGYQYRCNISNGCLGKTNIATLSVEETLGVNAFDETMFKIFPNPTTHSFTITHNSRIDLQKLDIYDLIGRIVKTVVFENKSKRQTIDVSNLKAATYFIKITSQEGSIIKKLIRD